MLSIFISVFKENDESVSDEASVTFSTLSQPLEIRVPPYIQSLPTTAVTLDVSRSTDPDNIPDKPRFFWVCAKVIGDFLLQLPGLIFEHSPEEEEKCVDLGVPMQGRDGEYLQRNYHVHPAIVSHCTTLLETIRNPDTKGCSGLDSNSKDKCELK